jgi:hypothetical protein
MCICISFQSSSTSPRQIHSFLLPLFSLLLHHRPPHGLSSLSSRLMVGNGSGINYERSVIYLLLIDGNVTGGKPICIMYGLPQGRSWLHGEIGRTRNLLVLMQTYHTVHHRTDKRMNHIFVHIQRRVCK